MINRTSRNHRENHVHPEDAEGGNGQPGFTEASRTDHVQAEDAESGRICKPNFTGASRTHHIHTEEAETRKMVSLTSWKNQINHVPTEDVETRKNSQPDFTRNHRGQITYILWTRRQEN